MHSIIDAISQNLFIKEGVPLSENWTISLIYVCIQDFKQ